MNVRRLELRHLLKKVEEQEITLIEAKEKCKQAKLEWDEFKKNKGVLRKRNVRFLLMFNRRWNRRRKLLRE